MPDLLERLQAALADRYTIEHELGRGGVATVYLTHDRKLGRTVALKVLRPELAASLGAERFLREIEITARLAHPHILAVFDSGEADGFLYYTMPYVEGESLRDRLTRQKQPPSRTRSRSRRKWRTRWATPTRRVWCIGTSNPRTSSSRRGMRW